MGFLGIYRAVYDYSPQAEGELSIKEGDVLLVLEKSDKDDWWSAKKKAASDEEEEPEGLIPNNYIEEARPTNAAKALYDYTRQTDEEISFTEDAKLQVYDTSDPDWTLVGNNGDYGFAPSNYIEITKGQASDRGLSDEEEKPPIPQRPTVVIAQEDSEPEFQPAQESPTSSPAANNPAIALAGIIHGKGNPASPITTRSLASPPPNIVLPPRAKQDTHKTSSEDLSAASAPRLPERSSTQTTPNPGALSPRSPDSQGVLPSPPYNRSLGFSEREDKLGGYHLYNVYEIVSYFGKNKKLPTTLGINIAKGIITISPESSKNGSQMEWTAERLSHYSIEGKHVFLELVRPSKSYDLHAGAKDTAEEIVSALGELAGAARAEGLKEVIAAGTGISGQKKGRILYDFMAQGDDEVTVAEGDDVIVLDETKSEEWWMVRRLKDDTVGVVPSSYIDITGIVTPPLSPQEANTARSFAQQNRLEEEALARKASSKQRNEGDVRGQEVGPGLQLPNRHSSLLQSDNDGKRALQKPKRDGRNRKSSASASKPDPNETRTWTDRSGSFKVEAQFIGLREGKIHLHKWNGVKIAVPVQKMSVEDLEYVEIVTGLSLDDEKPLSEVRKRANHGAKNQNRNNATNSTRAKSGIAIEQPKKPEYDWFDFFLQCGVNPQVCERYASAFAKDAMGEEVLPDVDANLLRTLGLKEGDILRVMKNLDSRFGRTQLKDKRNVSFAVDGRDGETGNIAAGGLYSGPGGALRNNTRKGRPASTAQKSDVIDPKLLEQGGDGETKPSVPNKSNNTSITIRESGTNGFEDNAWEPRPSRVPATSTSSTATSPQQTSSLQPQITGSLAELSLLSPPLEPAAAPQATQSSNLSNSQTSPSSSQATQLVGANSSLFDQVAKTTSLQPQLTQQQRIAAPRVRPQVPQPQNQNSLISPPPLRSSSAPQNPQQQSAFVAPILQPQLTGYQNNPNIQAQVAPSGQSLQELQQQQQLQPQLTFTPQNFGMQPIPNGILPQPTGFAQYASQRHLQNPNLAPLQQQPQFTGFAPAIQNQQQTYGQQQTGSPFADPPRAPFQAQPTGFEQPTFSTVGLIPQPTGINAFLPPALQPERTGMNGNNRPGSQGGMASVSAVSQQQQQQLHQQQLPPLLQQLTAAAPLIPQKTGPAPPVRFGVTGGTGAKKLAPQPTGRRANLSQATPDNPFGF